MYPFICFKLHKAVPAKITSEIFLKQLMEPFSYACKNIPLLLIVDECIAFEVDSIGRSKSSWKFFFNIRQVLYKFSITTSSDLHQTLNTLKYCQCLCLLCCQINPTMRSPGYGGMLPELGYTCTMISLHYNRSYTHCSAIWIIWKAVIKIFHVIITGHRSYIINAIKFIN